METFEEQEVPRAPWTEEQISEEIVNILQETDDSNDDTLIDETDVTQGPPSVIKLENIHKTYLLGVEGVAALRGVSLDIKQGEWIIIFGPSGSGKTTMLNTIGTIDTPTKGSLTIGGLRITSTTSDETLARIRRDKLGFVFQTFNLLSSMMAANNVQLPMVLAGRNNPKERSDRSDLLLDRVGMLQRSDHHPSQLSGGEQQRVTIARAISNEPAILLLDEPTGDLDTGNTAMVIKLLWELNTFDHITLIMVTHDVGLKNLAHRVVWMRDGKIQRTERISPEKRRKRINELRGKLGESEFTTQEFETVSKETVDKKDATVTTEKKVITHKYTTVRSAMHYKTFQHLAEHGQGVLRTRVRKYARGHGEAVHQSGHSWLGLSMHKDHKRQDDTAMPAPAPMAAMLQPPLGGHKGSSVPSTVTASQNGIGPKYDSDTPVISGSSGAPSSSGQSPSASDEPRPSNSTTATSGFAAVEMSGIASDQPTPVHMAQSPHLDPGSGVGPTLPGTTDQLEAHTDSDSTPQSLKTDAVVPSEDVRGVPSLDGPEFDELGKLKGDEESGEEEEEEDGVGFGDDP